MVISRASPELRRLLYEITKLPRDKHAARISELGIVHQHSIKLASATDTPTTSPDDYTCFMHAFNLVTSWPVIEIARTFENETYPSGAFVAYLVDRHLSEISHEEAPNGGLLVYSGAGAILHAGKFIGDKVISKWGLVRTRRARAFSGSTQWPNCLPYTAPKSGSSKSRDGASPSRCS